MSIKPVLSFRGAFVVALLLCVLGIASFAFSGRVLPQMLAEVFAPSAAAAQMRPESEKQTRGVKREMPAGVKTFGADYDGIVFGKGDYPLFGSQHLRKDKIFRFGGPTLLDLGSVNDFEPAWSPDGTKIAFVSLRDGPAPTNYFTRQQYRNIYTMNADGSDQRRIGGSIYGAEYQPSYSHHSFPPDQRIVFAADYSWGGQSSGIYSMDINGNDQVLLSDGSECEPMEQLSQWKKKRNELFPGAIFVNTPNYSPDDQFIIFSMGGADGDNVYRIDANGSGCTRIYTGTAGFRAAEARYSPDGTKIALYHATGDGLTHTLRIINSTTGAIIQDIVPLDGMGNPNFSGTPVWDPSGAPNIAYLAGDMNPDNILEDREIWTIDISNGFTTQHYIQEVREGIRGLDWGVPSSVVPALSMRINAPHPILGGTSSTGTLSRATPAPAGGVTIPIQVFNPSGPGQTPVATIPVTSVFIPEGETQVTFPIDAPLPRADYRAVDIFANSPNPNFGQALATISVTPARPDLRAISITGPASVAPGVAFGINTSVDNIGQATTGTGWTDQVYFSVDDQFDATDSLIRTTNNSTALAVGATRSLTNLSTTVSASIAPSSGLYYLFLRVNPNETVIEGGRTTNNVAMTTIQINLPDIVAENIVLPSVIEPGVTYPVSWTTRNAGTATSGTFSSRLYYSPDATLGDANDILLDTVSNTALAPNATQNHNVNINISTVPARPDGTAYFYVRADYGNNVYEGLPAGTGENNNTTTANTAFEYRVADLQVASTVAPAEVDTDAAFAMEWTTTNAGNKAAGTFSERVYFSPDNQVGGGDVLLGTFSLPGGLAAGASVNRIQNVTIPTSAIATTGNYFVYVQTDSSTNINEGENEGNNTRFQAVFVRRLLRPDLTITNVQAPNAAFFDQTIQVQWTVTNSGLGPTNASNWKDRVSMNTTGSTSGTLIDVSSISALAPGESYIASATVKVPRGYNGSYQVVVFTDIQGVLNEESTVNNKLTRPITINVPPLPDLTVSNVQAPGQAFAGGPINVSWQVNNFGNAVAQSDNQVLNKPWSWSDRVYLSRDTTLNTSEDRLIHTRTSRSTPLAAGASYTNNTQVVTSTGAIDYALLPNDVEGLYYVFVLTDYSNTIFEFSAENNNSAYDEIGPVGSPINILVTPADLVINTQPTAPPSSSGGQYIDVSFTVTNQGAFATDRNWTDAIYLSTDQTFGGDTILGTKTNSSLTAGGSRLVEMRVQLPECVTTGNYYLLARTDTGNAIAEFDPGYDAEANNDSSARPIAITTLPSDLSAANVQFSPITTPGQSVTVTWTESNTGTGPTAYQWVDRIVLRSLDGLGSVELRRVTQQGSIAAGQSVPRSAVVTLPAFMQGQYVFTIQTDYSRNVTECGTAEDNNNTDSGSFSVTNNLPDLVVDSLTIPVGPVGVGATFQVEYTARNAGGQLTTPEGWRDAVYLSSNPTLDSSDRRIGYANRQVDLAPGETYSQTVNANTGNIPSGQYYIIVVADFDTDVYEGPEYGQFETNNARVSNVMMFTSPDVDLQAVVNSVTTPTYSGSSVLVNWTVTNHGATQTLSNNWTDYIILSRDSIIDPSDRVLGYLAHEQVLAGGSNYTVSRSVYIPQGLTDLYRIFVITDYTNKISEVTDTNNTSPGFNVTLQLLPPADLNVTNISVPAGSTPGGSALFEWTVQNSGAFPAVGPWRDSVYLSRDQFWDASDYLIGQRERTGGALAVSATEVETQGFYIPFIEEGDYYVIVRLDSQNRVRESNEANNVSVSVSQMPITVQTLTMNTPFMTTLVNSGQKAFKFDPPADETVIVSLEGEEGNSNELFTNFFSAASRADYDFQGSGERTDDQENFIPNTETGRYYTMVSHDYIPPQDVLFDKQPEKIVNGQIGTVPVPPQNITISASVLPFSVHRVSPTTAGNKGIATLTLKGAKFQNGLTARLERSGSTPLTPIHLKNTATHIVAVFDLAETTPGQYDVVVTNPDKQVTRVVNGFEVVNGGGYSLTKSINGPSGFRAGQSNLRMTFSVRNTGLNDALFVPVIISFRSSVTYEIDPEDVRDLPDDMLPSGMNRADLPPHIDIDGKRYLMLMIPLLRSNTSWDIGIDLRNIGSSGFEVAMAALPSLSDLRDSTNQPAPETITALRDLAPSISAGECWAEFARQMLFIIFDLVPLAGCADEIISAHAAFISYVSGIVVADAQHKDPAESAFGGSLAQFGANILKNALECAGGESTPLKIINFLWNMYNLLVLLRECLDNEIKTWIGYFQGLDPNEKLGPNGFGTEGFVPVGSGMLYRINFENLPSATGPAQRIIITDQLPPTLDPRTVRLKEIGFKQNRIIIPDNQAFYQARIQLGPDQNNLSADISAGLDIVNGRVSWTLSAIDPLTGEAPLDPEAGLLPPNNENHDGEGYVTFTIEPKATYPNRTAIENSASIIFDVNEPIVTNTTTNLLDSVVPASTMAPLPAISSDPSITFAWNGTDDNDGSGFKKCEIRASMDGGAFIPIFSDTTLGGSGTLVGRWGKHYAFQSICSDNAGNVEMAPITPDAETTVLGGDTEADLAPRPNGNDGLLDGGDTEQVRRFVAGLDTDFTFNEFQRSDMSPRDGGGNGTLSVADIMQARRYVAGLDAKTDAAGPNEPSGLAPRTVPGKKAAMLPREIKGETIARFQNQIIVGIRLEAQGDETGLGFGLNFDPAVLSNPVVELGTDAGGSTLTVNTAQAGVGKLGIILDRPPNSPIAAGSKLVLRVVFDIANGAPMSTQLTFGNDPVVAEVVDGLANSLTTTFSPSTISLVGPTTAGVAVSGTVMRSVGVPLRNARVTITDASGNARSAVTGTFGHFRFEDIAAGQNYTISVRAKGYVFTPRLIAVSDEVSGIEIMPEPE